MNKKLISFFMIVIAIVIVSIFMLNNHKATSIKTIDDVKRIDYQDTFDQSEEEYIVYFWQESCKYCIEVEPDVLEYAENSDTPIYLVDMQSSANQEAWYDWELHHEQFDLVIGKIVDGEEVINEDVDVLDFMNDTEVNWSITANEIDQIVASHNTPFGNVEPKDTNEIEVTGTPTMIQVKNGKFHSYAVGVDQVRALLSSSGE